MSVLNIALRTLTLMYTLLAVHTGKVVVLQNYPEPSLGGNLFLGLLLFMMILGGTGSEILLKQRRSKARFC